MKKKQRNLPATAGAGRAKTERGPIRNIETGVPGLDAILGGGLPEYSFNLIAGGPGTGKTTLAQQIIFAQASASRPAIYFTVLGEPTLKMLRYQRQFSFFELDRVGSEIHFINLSNEVLEQDLSLVLERMVAEVERIKPGFVVVDSFRTFTGHGPRSALDGMPLDHFVQRLALHLTTWEVTSFLIGEYDEAERRNPVFTVADGVFWLSQVTDRNSVVRKFQAMKVRARAHMPGLHTFRITGDGLQIFPRIPEQQSQRSPQEARRLSTGIPGLDDAMGGGIPAGDAVLIAGPAGSGKTTFATQFAAEGLRNGEPTVIVVFEEYPEEYLMRAGRRNPEMHDSLGEGILRIMYLRPLDLSVDETLAEMLDAVREIDAVRVVIDSLSGFEVALAPAFREDFKESLYRLVGALTATGVTVLMTSEITGGYPDPHFTSEKVSFITDDIVVQRLVEVGGELKKVLMIHKMRGSNHSREFLTYDVGEHGAVIQGPLRNYHGITTGIPEFQRWSGRPDYTGLTERETIVFEMLARTGSGSLDQLAARLGWRGPELKQATDRLRTLGFVASSDDGTTLHAVAQPGF